MFKAPETHLSGPQDLSPFPHKMKYKAVIAPLITEGTTCKLKETSKRKD